MPINRHYLAYTAHDLNLNLSQQDETVCAIDSSFKTPIRTSSFPLPPALNASNPTTELRLDADARNIASHTTAGLARVVDTNVTPGAGFGIYDMAAAWLVLPRRGAIGGGRSKDEGQNGEWGHLWDFSF
ncbi:hypothetical protein GX50_03379 [[Emmonsia] crescens]|uniref:Uncharacterized protein n=1 Tax=[Emmonsia] crescens TaxID=73230 RepID=A0A2B7ZKF4_9EURO|nr:hypothetical protein GX50_03379 [Emmonsia crescens]